MASPPSRPNQPETYLRLQPHPITSIPTHPSLTTTTTTTADPSTSPPNPSLPSFLTTLLPSALHFTDDLLPDPQTFVLKTTKPSPPSSTPVSLHSYTRPSPTSSSSSSKKTGSKGREKETWFARRSTHANASKPGTAKFHEFDAGLRQDHSVHEGEYTPGVVHAREVCRWDKGEIAAAVDQGDGDGDGDGDGNGEGRRAERAWGGVEMSVYEMVHKLPAPLTPRVFGVLVVTAVTHSSSQGSQNTSTNMESGGDGDVGQGEGEGNGDGFIVIQIPLDLSDVPQAWYANGRCKTGTADGGEDGGSGVKDVVVGAYTSVERCRLIRTAGDGEEREQVQWDMATASDAGGALPMWMQKMGTPGAIVKDVGLFMEWAAKRRKM